MSKNKKRSTTFVSRQPLDNEKPYFFTYVHSPRDGGLCIRKPHQYEGQCYECHPTDS